MLKRSAFLGMMGIVLSVLTAIPASAENRWVTIHNYTGYDMVRFYGSHRDASTWEEDILGSDILPNGYSVNINFDDGTGYCVFDFRAEFSDGDVLVRQGVNVCEIGDFYYE